MNIKKTVALLLTAVMCLSCSLSALAIEEDQTNEYTDAVLNRPSTGLATVFGNSYYDDLTQAELDEAQALIDSYTPASTTATTYPNEFPKDLLNSSSEDQLSDEEIYRIINALLPVMTFEEKVYMLSMNSDPDSRSGVGYMPGIPRLGVPETRYNDGPAGISPNGSTYRETTNMPNELILGSTWSEELSYKYGSIYGTEHVSSGLGWQLGTQYDLARTSYQARTKDSFGEDYYLTGQMAAAMTEGVQENGAIAMAKHIGAYATDGDTSLWVEVNDQTLHTAYLYTFEMAAKNAQLGSIMGTYNRLNGYYTSSNYQMQVNTLRNMWNWGGAMVPDWGANKEFSLMLGTDISQDNYSSVYSSIVKALAAGNLTLKRVDTAVEKALYAYGVAGYLNLVEIDEATGLAKEDASRNISDYVDTRIKYTDTYEEDRAAGLYEDNNAITQEVAEKGIVLLKNENSALPVADDGSESVAVIGSGAMRLMGGTGGERSFGVLEYMKTPAETLTEAFGAGSVNAAITNDIHGTAIPAELLYLNEAQTLQGFIMDGIYKQNRAIEYLTGDRSFKNTANGEAFTNGESHTFTTYVNLGGSQANNETGNVQSLVIQTNGGTASMTVEGTKLTNGTYESASARGSASNGVSWDDYTVEGFNYRTVSVSDYVGVVKITITTTQTDSYRDQGLRLAWIMKSDAADNIQASYDAIDNSDTVVMFTRTGATGHGPVFQTSWNLSLTDKAQVSEFAAYAKAQGKTFVLVVFSRAAFSFEGDWLENTDALISSYYAGQSYATALANIITGEVNPSGKTVLTFPETSEATLLTFDETTKVVRAGNQTQSEYTAQYTEGLNFGYRWYYTDEAISSGSKAQYSFGHGLSYTTFDYSNMTAKMDTANKEIKVTVDVTNTGSVAGDEIVQVYLGDINLGVSKEYVQFAERQLVAYSREENLAPGETRTVEMTISERMLSYWDQGGTDAEIAELKAEGEYDETIERWAFAEGKRDIMVGAASDDIRLTISNFNVTTASNLKAVLLDLINEADALVGTDEYNKTYDLIREYFDTALNEAKAVYNDAFATDDEVTDAWLKLVDAMGYLSAQPADYAKLSILVDLADRLELSKYNVGVDAFITALSNAKAVLADMFATQDEVNSAYTALLKAIGAMRYEVDKSKLQDLYNRVNGIDTSLYTTERIQVFLDALNFAKSVLDDPDATQDIVTFAYDKLDEADQNLIPLSGGISEPDPSSEPDTSSDNTPADGSDTDNNSEATNSGTATSSAPKTGDYSTIVLLASLIGLTGVVVVLFKKRRSSF